MNLYHEKLEIARQGIKKLIFPVTRENEISCLSLECSSCCTLNIEIQYNIPPKRLEQTRKQGKLDEESLGVIASCIKTRKKYSPMMKFIGCILTEVPDTPTHDKDIILISFFSCGWLEKNRCSRYKERPPVCRKYKCHLLKNRPANQETENPQEMANHVKNAVEFTEEYLGWDEVERLRKI